MNAGRTSEIPDLQRNEGAMVSCSFNRAPKEKKKRTENVISVFRMEIVFSMKLTPWGAREWRGERGEGSDASVVQAHHDERASEQMGQGMK